MAEKKKPIVSPDKVVSSGKKSVGKKIADDFIKEDLSDIKDIIIFDWILPGFKNMILNTLSMMFFNEPIDYKGGRYRSDSRRDNRYGKTRYGSYYEDSRNDRDRRDRDRRRRDEDEKVDYRNLVVSDRKSAEDIVRAMYDEIHDNRQVSIAQLLELLGLPSEHIDCSWGWTNPRDIDIQRVRDGFLIKVTEARYLD